MSKGDDGLSEAVGAGFEQDQASQDRRHGKQRVHRTRSSRHLIR